MASDHVCVYCGVPCLVESDPPEHVVPRALGGSFYVRTVCGPCNEWASVNVDQPFLSDHFVMMLRSIHDIRPPGSRRGKRVKNPLLRGFTKDGAFAWMDETGQPHVRGQIVPGDEPGSFEIRATSEEEADELARRVERDAKAEGRAVERGEYRHSEGHVEITGEVNASLAVWPRMAAKIALSTGSYVFGPDWRSSSEAVDLRHVLRDEPSHLMGEKPRGFPKPISSPVNLLVQPPEHALFFQRDSEQRVLLVIILFGEQVMALPIGSAREALPRTAWRLDPSRPDANGETTFEGLMLRHIERLADEEAGTP